MWGIMTVNTLYGLTGQEVLEPCYLDIKHLNDKTAETRERVRSKIITYKRLRKELAISRDLMTRYCLKKEMDLTRRQVCAVWEVYRGLQRDSTMMCSVYFQLTANRRKK